MKEKIEKNEVDGESMNEEQVSVWFEQKKLDFSIKELASKGKLLKQQKSYRVITRYDRRLRNIA